MITKDVFLKIVEINQRNDSNTDLLRNIGIYIIDSPFNEDLYFLTNYIISKEYNKEGLDWFSWWLYELPMMKEKHDSKEHFAYNEDGTPIILDTPEQLYEFLEENYKNE